jgi:Secretion system C-terminal sorting domain
LNITWIGSDNLSGIEYYNIYAAENNSGYRLWKRFTLEKDTAKFVGKFGSTYRFYSIAVDSASNIESKPTLADAFTKIPGVTSVTNGAIVESWLGQNRPNPFNTQTEIDFYLRNPSQWIDIQVFNVAGLLISKYEAANIPEGRHTATLTLDNASPGIYFYHLTTQEELRMIKRMVVEKNKKFLM